MFDTFGFVVIAAANCHRTSTDPPTAPPRSLVPRGICNLPCLHPPQPPFDTGLRKTSKFKAGTIVFVPSKPVAAAEAAEADVEKLDSFFGGDDTSQAAEEEATYVRVL